MIYPEPSKRRPDFHEPTVPILLADGQTWHFPKPHVYLSPQVIGGRVVSMSGNTTFGAEFDSLVAALKEAAESDNAYQILHATAALGCFMLTLNYDLTDAELRELLTFRVDLPDTWDRVKAIMGVAYGRGPKLSNDGDGSP
jgi:hypothetical protein